MTFLYVVPQFLLLSQHILHQQNLLSKVKAFYIPASTIHQLPHLCPVLNPHAALGKWIDFAFDYFSFQTAHHHCGLLEINLQPINLKCPFYFRNFYLKFSMLSLTKTSHLHTKFHSSSHLLHVPSLHPLRFRNSAAAA